MQEEAVQDANTESNYRGHDAVFHLSVCDYLPVVAQFRPS